MEITDGMYGALAVISHGVMLGKYLDNHYKVTEMSQIYPLLFSTEKVSEANNQNIRNNLVKPASLYKIDDKSRRRV